MNRVTCLLFLGVLTSGMTQFALAGSTGTIHFYGAIFDGECRFDTGGNKVTSRCERGGKTVTQVRDVDSQNPLSFNLPLSMGKVSTEYVNHNPRLAIMTVSYN